jgi:hypothetical protein
MADTYKPESENRSHHLGPKSERGSEAGRTLLVGLAGGLLSAAGYTIYQRLPEDQKQRLHAQAREFLSSRFNDIRQNFNI